MEVPLNPSAADSNQRVERFLRVIAVVGGVIAASWGIQWAFRAEHLFGREAAMQLPFSLLITLLFARRARGGRTDRWSWLHIALLCAVWAWRCAWKHYPLGVAAFSLAAGLATVGLLVATWQTRARADG
jgi:hypothetical protein